MLTPQSIPRRVFRMLSPLLGLILLVALLPAPAQAASRPVTYLGGDILTAPKIYAITFSAPSAGALPPRLFASSAPNLPSALAAFSTPAYYGWWSHQYSLPAKSQVIAPPSYAGHLNLIDPQLALSSIVDTTAIDAYLSSSPDLPVYSPNNIFVIYLRAHQNLTSGSAGTNDARVPLCALHNRTPGPDPIEYDVIPYTTDPGCLPLTPGPTPSTRLFNLTSFLTVHELVETITDPQLAGVAWISIGSSITELADACANSPLARVAYQGLIYSFPEIYSDLAGACLSSMPPQSLAYSLSASSSDPALTVLLPAPAPVNQEIYLVGPTGSVLTSCSTGSGTSCALSLPAPSPLPLSVFYAGSSTSPGTLVPLADALVLAQLPSHPANIHNRP